MPRFHIPLAVDFTTRSPTISSALAKATYIQNGYVHADMDIKMYNRPGIKQAATGYDSIMWCDILPGLDGGYVLFGYPSGGGFKAYTATDLTSSPTAFATISDSPKNWDSVYYQRSYSYKEYFGHSSLHYWYINSFGTVTETGPGLGFSRTIYRGNAVLDQYAFCLATTTSVTAPAIFNCTLATPTTWAGTDYIIPDANGGSAVGIESFKQHVVYFGTRNIQFFFDAANASGSPLLPRKDLVYNFGIYYNYGTAGVGSDVTAKPWWKSHSGDILAFTGNNFDGHKFIGLFDASFQYQKISTPFIDAILDEYSDIYLSGYTYAGKSFIHVSVGAVSDSANALNLYYDIETKLWHVFNTGLTDFAYIPAVGSSADSSTSSQTTTAFITPNTSHNSYNTNFGNLFYFAKSTDSHQDVDTDGTTHTISMVIQLPRYRGEQGYQSQRKFMHELQLIADTQASTDNISFQFSDDDYQNFTTARTIDMSQTLKQLNRLGYFRERVFKITYSGTNQIRLESLEGYLRLGKN